MKALTRNSLRQAIHDISEDYNGIRKKVKYHYVNLESNYFVKPEAYVDYYIPSASALDTKENRWLNEQLGLNGNDGIKKWYK